MSDFSGFPNTMHSDKWRLVISNVPTLKDTSDMRYFENYLKSCTIPNYTIGEILFQLPNGFQVRHPLGGMKKNQDLGNINLTFKLSEDMYNYLLLLTWMMQLRYGQIDPAHEGYFREYNIKSLIIQMLDNQKRVIAELKFTNLFLLDLGALDLEFGSTEQINFTTSFSYEELIYEIKNPMTGGRTLDAPVNITECGTSGVPVNPDLDWDDNN